METSETLIEVKNVCQEFHLTKGLLQSLRFEKGKLVKEEKAAAVNLLQQEQLSAFWSQPPDRYSIKEKISAT